MEMNREDYRKNDRIYSKRRNENGKYGENDELILQKALSFYRSQKGTTFKYLQVWNIMKLSKKWQDIKSLETFTDGSSK